MAGFWSSVLTRAYPYFMRLLSDGLSGFASPCFQGCFQRPETYPLRDKLGHFMPPDVIDLYVREDIIGYRNGPAAPSRWCPLGDEATIMGRSVRERKMSTTTVGAPRRAPI